ncbi:ABC transporter permease [Gloeobacter kilaueensis]|uniref:Macrolide transporter ATP-binding /permease protein n=1 Tax=Gloeobacter kilaueensis (strain ATCC BAA-2537 / CCAP 1431/1 / ULC 316 / JS1) TaxID=1183438 RepID=U5QMP9_GLOK1|nr:ABC transporter permease [Gloeobacter kilaueensis]AGY60277.1 macrolide transporter ATP-binding /permease protein [Gloeobacter kilaueensis JS1]
MACEVESDASAALPLAERCYGLLLLAYPAEFRAEYASEMLQLFADERRDEGRRRGMVGMVQLWLRTIANVAVTATAEHWDGLRRDLSYGLQMLLARPAFAVVAIAVLAVGIGASTAFFSVIDAVLLRPLPFPGADRLVIVEQQSRGNGGGVSYPNFLDWRARNHVFSSMAVFNSGYFALRTAGPPERVAGAVVSADLFSLLGVRAQRGRTFLPVEDRLGGGPVGRAVILSDSLWQRRFGGSANVIGRALSIDGLLYTVIGVMGPQFHFPLANEPAQLWVSVAADAEPTLYGGTIPISRGYPHYRAAIARLKNTAGLEVARAELDLIARNLASTYPAYDAETGVRVTPALQWLTGTVRSPLLVLFLAVGCLLLIACTNVANLLLARASSRGREIALRAALGATRGRIARQLLTESLLLAILGGVGGIGFAWIAVEGLAGLLPAGLPRAGEIGLDGRVLSFALLLSLITGIGFGLAPTASLLRTELAGVLKQAAPSLSGGGNSLRRGLVVAEVALAMVLLVGAGLLLASFVQLLQVAPGFRAQGVLSLNIALPESTYPQRSVRVVHFYDQLLGRIRTLPGVQRATIAQSVPLSGADNGTNVELEGRPTVTGNRLTTALRFVGLDYFQTLGIPIQRGRDFLPLDDATAPERAIVNAAFVRRYFASSDPIGRRIRLGFGGKDYKQIIAVVGDVHHTSLGEAVEPEVYVPQAQYPMNEMNVLVLATGDPQRLTRAIQAIVREMDDALPVYGSRSLEELIASSLATPRFWSVLLGLFAAAALLLSAAGIYGVTEYAVAQRTREIGLRLALGATPTSVLRLVIFQGMAAVLVGVGVGALLAFVFAHFLSSQLFGISATDPLIYLIAATILTGVALVACYLPARRATRVDPMVALRCE